MITKFKITKLPLRAILKISSIPVVLNQEYHISEQENMTCDITERGVPFDEFLFQLGNDNGIWSNVSKSVINVQVDSNTPTVILTDLTIAYKETIDITGNFNFNTSTDRVIITSISPKSNLSPSLEVKIKFSI